MKSPAGRIEVFNENGVPRSFKWRGRMRIVRTVLERWKDTGRWWEGESVKLFFRVETADGGFWEIYLDTGTQMWHLYRVYD